jgi:hypothetical protein
MVSLALLNLWRSHGPFSQLTRSARFSSYSPAAAIAQSFIRRRIAGVKKTETGIA